MGESSPILDLLALELWVDHDHRALFLVVGNNLVFLPVHPFVQLGIGLISALGQHSCFFS